MNPFSSPLLSTDLQQPSIPSAHDPRRLRPIHNPWDKFTQSQFDDFIDDITGALKKALYHEHHQPPPVRRRRPLSRLDHRKADILSATPPVDERTHSTEPEENEDADEEIYDSPPDISSRLAKGKARDPREGPGLGSILRPTVLHSEDEQAHRSSDDQRRSEEEDEAEHVAEDEEQNNDESEGDTEFAKARLAEAEHEQDVFEISSNDGLDLPRRDHHNAGEVSYSQNTSDEEETSEDHGGDDGLDQSGPFVQGSSGLHPAIFEQQTEEVEDFTDSDLDSEDEIEDRDAQKFSQVSFEELYSHNNLPRDDVPADVTISPEVGDSESSEAFPPCAYPVQPVEIEDPWEGPRMYAQDYYAGGDRFDRENATPSHITPDVTRPASPERDEESILDGPYVDSIQEDEARYLPGPEPVLPSVPEYFLPENKKGPLTFAPSYSTDEEIRFIPERRAPATPCPNTSTQTCDSTDAQRQALDGALVPLNPVRLPSTEIEGQQVDQVVPVSSSVEKMAITSEPHLAGSSASDVGVINGSRDLSNKDENSDNIPPILDVDSSFGRWSVNVDSAKGPSVRTELLVNGHVQTEEPVVAARVEQPIVDIEKVTSKGKVVHEVDLIVPSEKGTDAEIPLIKSQLVNGNDGSNVQTNSDLVGGPTTDAACIEPSAQPVLNGIPPPISANPTVPDPAGYSHPGTPKRGLMKRLRKHLTSGSGLFTPLDDASDADDADEKRVKEKEDDDARTGNETKGMEGVDRDTALDISLADTSVDEVAALIAPAAPQLVHEYESGESPYNFCFGPWSLVCRSDYESDDEDDGKLPALVWPAGSDSGSNQELKSNDGHVAFAADLDGKVAVEDSSVERGGRKEGGEALTTSEKEVVSGIACDEAQPGLFSLADTSVDEIAALVAPDGLGLTYPDESHLNGMEPTPGDGHAAITGDLDGQAAAGNTLTDVGEGTIEGEELAKTNEEPVDPVKPRPGAAESNDAPEPSAFQFMGSGSKVAPGAVEDDESSISSSSSDSDDSDSSYNPTPSKANERSVTEQTLHQPPVTSAAPSVPPRIGTSEDSPGQGRALKRKRDLSDQVSTTLRPAKFTPSYPDADSSSTSGASEAFRSLVNTDGDAPSSPISPSSIKEPLSEPTSPTSENVPPSPVMLSHGPLQHHHGPARQKNRALQRPRRLPPVTSAPPSKEALPPSPMSPPESPARILAPTLEPTTPHDTSLGFVMRSQCRYHQISLPRYPGGPRVSFLVPHCSLPDNKLMEEEEIQDHGVAMEKDTMTKIADIESLDFPPALLAVLRKLTGVGVLRDKDIFYLPQPGESYSPKAPLSLPLKGLPGARDGSKSESTEGMSPQSRRRSRAGASSPRVPHSSASSSLAGSSRLSHSFSEALSIEDEKSEQAGSQEKGQEKGKVKRVTRRSKRLSRDAAAYKPDPDEEEEDEEEERGTQRRRSTKKRARAGEEDGNTQKKKRGKVVEQEVIPQQEELPQKRKRTKTKKALSMSD